MINALKLVSLNRGYDPRDFTLVAFGGGGGMHAVALAAELGIRKVVIPRAADVFSAWGMLMSDLRRDYFVTRLLPLEPRAARAAIDGAARRADRRLRSTQFAHEGDRRRAGALPPLRQPALREPGAQRRGAAARRARSTRDAVEAIAAAFHESYEREYTYRLDAPVEFVGAHLVAIAEVGKLAPARAAA